MNGGEDDVGKGYEIVVEEDWVLLRVEPGHVVTADLLLAMLRELYALEAYRSEKKAGFWDFRGCTSDIRFDGMMRVKEFIETAYDPSWTHQFTAVVADAELLYGLARMYEILTSDIATEFQIFRGMAEARDWLKAQVA